MRNYSLNESEKGSLSKPVMAAVVVLVVVFLGAIIVIMTRTKPTDEPAIIDAVVNDEIAVDDVESVEETQTVVEDTQQPEFYTNEVEQPEKVEIAHSPLHSPIMFLKSAKLFWFQIQGKNILVYFSA